MFFKKLQYVIKLDLLYFVYIEVWCTSMID